MRMACVYFPKWPLQHARQRLQREGASPARNTPLALYESTAHGPRLSAVSPAAQKAGVQVGMGLADARALLPGIELLENRPDLQLQELERLALFCGRFSPHVGVEPTGEHRRYPFALFLNITGCAGCFGGEDTLLVTMLQALRGRGYIAQAAAAPTIGAAWALAHGGRFAAVLPSLPAPLVGEGSAVRAPLLGEGPGARGAVGGPALKARQKFIRIDESDLPRALEDLPIAALRLNPEAIGWLSKLGLHRISDILRQPRETLPSRFGSELLQRIDQALRAVPETFTSLLAPAEFHAARALEAPAGDLPQLYPLLEKLTASLCKDLRKKARGVRELECWLYHEISDPRSVTVSFFQPTSSAKHVMELLRVRLEDAFQLGIAALRSSVRNGNDATEEPQLTTQQLEEHRTISLRPVVPIRSSQSTIRNVEERGVIGITLRVTHNEPLSKEQLSLFRRATASQSLSLLLDRMRTELGPENVRQVRLRSHVLPEQTVEWRAADGHCDDRENSEEDDGTQGREDAETRGEAAQRETDGSSPLIISASTRPTSLLSAPIRIRVNWGDQVAAPDSVELPAFQPMEHSGTRSRRTRLTHKIVAAKGPERIEGGWWQKRGGARRDYYVIETESGARYFIYQDLPSGDWFLHGTFD